MRLLLRLWPGFHGLVRYGRWSFLAVALTFALVLDLLLVLNFFWTSYISVLQRNILFGALLVVWVTLGAIASQMERHLEALKHADAQSDGFREALLQYLRGNWFEAQCCLNALLQRNGRDVESLLMLATLQRHTLHHEEARQTLQKLEILEEADRWFVEIETEKQLLNQSFAPVEE